MIFNLFKSKPTLKELIPNGSVDIHSHIIPGIDDGAKNIDESLKLIKGMKKIGFSKIIGTPHTYPSLYENTSETIQNAFNELKKNLNIKIDIHFASEYLICNDLIKKSEKKKLLTIKDKFVLVETNFIAIPNNFHEIIFNIIHNGYTPIIAHPERYRFLFSDKQEILKLKQIGCKLQLNLFSTIGYYGNDIIKNCDLLLKNKLIDYYGTDIHKAEQISNFNKKIQIKEIEKLRGVINLTNDTFNHDFSF